jgi:hypothetical protein
LLEELLAGDGKLSGPIFHFYTVKDNTTQAEMQEKNTKYLKNVWSISPRAEYTSTKETRGFKKCKTLG